LEWLKGHKNIFESSAWYKFGTRNFSEPHTEAQEKNVYYELDPLLQPLQKTTAWQFGNMHKQGFQSKDMITEVHLSTEGFLWTAALSGKSQALADLNHCIDQALFRLYCL
jgi:hypothetical protein